MVQIEYLLFCNGLGDGSSGARHLRVTRGEDDPSLPCHSPGEGQVQVSPLNYDESNF